MTRLEVSNNAILEDWISKPSIESMPLEQGETLKLNRQQQSR
jgi:hypothetical protein